MSTTASKKAKGRKAQQWVRDLIYSVFPELDKGDVGSRSMGAQGEDIMLSPKARNLFPYSVEVKHHKAFSIYNVYKQATDNCNGGNPLAIIKQDRSRALAVVDAEYFIRLHKFIKPKDLEKVNNLTQWSSSER